VKRNLDAGHDRVREEVNIQIFLSYDARDRDRAGALRKSFRKCGWSVWWDQDIPPGSKYRDAILQAVTSASCVVVLWSRHSVTSHWVREEAQKGIDRGALMPVLLEEGLDLPLGFGELQAAHLFGWDGSPDHPALLRLTKQVGMFLAPDVLQPRTGAEALLILALAVIAFLVLRLG
jgi:hypothetical protein